MLEDSLKPSGVDRGGLRAAGDLELIVDIGEVILDGLVTEAEARRDLFVRLAVRNERQDAAFLVRERLRFGLGGRIRQDPQPLQGLLRDVGVQQGLPGRDGLDGLNQGLRIDIFQDIALRAGEDSRGADGRP